VERKVIFSLIILLIGSAVLGATGPNLINNPSAEIYSGVGYPDGWKIWTASGNPQYSVDQTQAYSGTNSWKLICGSSTDRGTWMTYDIPMKPNTKVSMGLHYKATGFPASGGGIYFNIYRRNKQGQAWPITRIDLNRNASDWTEKTSDFLTIPDETEYVYIAVEISSVQGTLWFDDVWLKVEESDDTVDPLPPVNLWANRVAADRVELTWNTPEEASDGDLPILYQIHRSEVRVFVPGTENKLAEVPSQPTKVSWTDDTVEPEKRYYYIVSSMDKVGNTASSSVAVANEEPRMSENLLKNPSFEEWESGLPKFWSVRKDGVHAADNADKIDGEFSAKITNLDASFYTSIYQNVVSKKNTDYLLVGWVKYENVVIGTGGIGGKVLICKPNGSTLANPLPSFKGNSPWQEVKIPFNSGEFEYFQVMLYLHKSTGSIWFDNFYLYEYIDGTPPEVPLDFTATRINGTRRTELSWQSSQPAPDGDLPVKYRVYWGSSPSFSLSPETLLVELPGTVLNWVHEASPSAAAYYVITALDKVGNESDPTAVVGIPKVGSLRGTVVAATDFSPLAGADVLIEELNLTFNTKPDGSFIIEGLLAQEYSLVVRLRQYKRERLNYDLAEGEDKDLGQFQMQWYNIPPKAPSVIEADGESHVGLIKVTWEIPQQDDPDNIVEVYNVYRSENNNVKREPSQLVASVGEPLFMDIRPEADYGKTFYYLVEAVNEAGIASVEASEVSFATVKAPPVPELLAPINGSLVLDSEPEFSWVEVVDRDLVGYVLEISSEPSFSAKNTIAKECSMSGYRWPEVLTQRKWFWRLRAKFDSGDAEVFSSWSETCEFVAINIQEGNELIPFYNVFPKALNSEEVEIEYLLTVGANVKLQVFNLGGKQVATLQSGFQEAGSHSILWPGIDGQERQLPNGLYFILLQAEAPGIERVKTVRKLVIIR